MMLTSGLEIHIRTLPPTHTPTQTCIHYTHTGTIKQLKRYIFSYLSQQLYSKETLQWTNWAAIKLSLKDISVQTIDVCGCQIPVCVVTRDRKNHAWGQLHCGLFHWPKHELATTGSPNPPRIYFNMTVVVYWNAKQFRNRPGQRFYFEPIIIKSLLELQSFPGGLPGRNELFS